MDFNKRILSVSRRDFIKLIGIAGTASLTGGCFADTAKESLLNASNSSKPNFLFILADDCQTLAQLSPGFLAENPVQQVPLLE